MASKRVTQSDIAAKAGVHRATVTLALKNHPSIPAKTRDRILQIAAELGYARDPMLSALAAYRSKLQPATFQGTLAWLSNSLDNWSWTTHKHFRTYYENACRRASFHGYQLEQFELQSPGMTPKRLASILRSRNIRGILVSPQPHPDTRIDFAWEDFPAVTFGFTLSWPQLHTVISAQYRGMVMVMRQLRARGYERIGYASPWHFEKRTDYNFMAGYLMEQTINAMEGQIPPLSYDYRGYAKEFSQWIRQHRIEAVVTADSVIAATLKELKLRAPEDIGVACFTQVLSRSELSGIAENSDHVGVAAVDQLVAMIHRGESGIPQIPQRILIECTWNEGTTVRPLPAKQSPPAN